jgi:hypothetical protein
MPKKIVEIGRTANDGQGDALKNAFAKVNENIDDIYAEKQDALVSGSSIKTINSTSILGSGNISVQPTLVSATNIKTINGNSVLGSGDLTISGGGGSGNILATHVLNKPRSGFYYGTGLYLNTNVTIMTNGVLTLSAFTPAYNLTVSELVMQVTTLLIGGLIKVVIYSDLNGVPHTKLFESATASTDTTGIKTITGFSFTFNAGTTYWISMVSNGSVGIRILNASSFYVAPIIAHSNSTQTYQSWFISSSFASLPSILTTPTTGNLNGGGIPYIVFRAT